MLWNALDFSALPAGDGVTVDLAAPAGTIAAHAGRTVRLESSARQPLAAVAGGEGDDTISGACMAVGGGGDDRLAGSSTGDLLAGGRGGDVLRGNGGRDTLHGGAGDDRIDGGAGADKLVGEAGDDQITGGADGDVYLFFDQDGLQQDAVGEPLGPGPDVLSLDFPTARAGRPGRPRERPSPPQARPRCVTAPGGAARFEGAIGGAGDDVLLGNDGPNHFWGGGGTDRVTGRSGNDVYHLDWSASMPAAAYASQDAWFGPIERGPTYGRSVFDVETRPASRLRITEGRRGGRDTLDLAEGWLASKFMWQRLEGQIRAGARVDLSGRDGLVRAGKISAFAGTPTTPANLENVRGTLHDDIVVGNSANNVLEGRQGRDRISAGGGRDTCLVHRRDDRLHRCERTLARDPDR